MKYCFIIFLLFYSVCVFAQEVEFFDVDGSRITKEQFEKRRNTRVNLPISTMEGKTVRTRLVSRAKTGVLSPDNVKAILSNLSEVSGKTVNSSDLIIINYHQGRSHNDPRPVPDTKSQVAFYKSYLRKVSRLKGASQFFVHASTEKLDYPENERNWYPDKDTLIQRTFFKYFFHHGSFILLNTDGEYYVYYGEYMLDSLLTEAKRRLKN